jgi:hypothetical protein
MICTALFVLCLPTFTFDGGTQHEFLKSLGKYLDVPVCRAVTTRKVPSMSVQWPQDKEGSPLSKALGLPVWLKQFAQATDSKVSHSTLVSMAPQTLPWYRFATTAEGRSSEAEFTIDASLLWV